tara:strand:- start:848 stop:1531 length:684 start_codon:yes stop_codon:yes gene_type:complete
MEAYNNIPIVPNLIQKIMDEFLSETKDELWDSESELKKYYLEKKNFGKLLRGEVGGNLIYKYKSKSLVYANKKWIEFLSQLCKKVIKTGTSSNKIIIKSNHEIDSISKFCINRLDGLLDKDAVTDPLYMESKYDIVAWLKSDESNKLSDFCVDGLPINYKFFYSQNQLTVRSDQFKRYGTDLNALSKIVTRVSNIERLTRKVSINHKEKDLFEDIDQDLFTRYSLSN